MEKLIMNNMTVLQRSPNAAVAEVGEAIIFLHEGKGVYFSLEGVGASFWRQLSTPKPFGELVKCIQGEYEVAEEVLIKDLVTLISEMVDLGLLVQDPQ
jgi:hypothetical protein